MHLCQDLLARGNIQSLARFCKPAIGGHEARQHVGDQSRGFKLLVGLVAQNACIVDQIPMDVCGQFHGELDGFVVGDPTGISR